MSNTGTEDPSTPSSQASELALLDGARHGDSHQFGELTEPYRRELQVHCYRILGSLQEAEDMVQETMLKAWKRLDTYEGRASFRAWLYKIATNTCLDYLDQQRSRRLLPPSMGPASNPTTVLPPVTEATWLEPFPDEWLHDVAAVNPEARYTDSESISLSFMTALQYLPARQRAILILCDVLDFSSRETAEVLDLTVSSVNSALHRARKTLSQNYQSEEASRPLTDERSQWLLDRFVQAWQTADVDGLVALLKADAMLAMPPSPSWYQGQEAIRTFISFTVFGDDGMFSGQASGRWRLVPTRANSSPAFALYQRTEKDEYQFLGIHVLEIDGDEIVKIVTFIDPSLPSRFGLLSTLSTK